jgi:hypothetical protein
MEEHTVFIAAPGGLVDFDLRIGKPSVLHHVIEVVGDRVVDAAPGGESAFHRLLTAARERHEAFKKRFF